MKTATVLRELIDVLRQSPPDTTAIVLATREACASVPLPEIDASHIGRSKRDAYIKGFEAAWADYAATIRGIQ